MMVDEIEQGQHEKEIQHKQMWPPTNIMMSRERMDWELDGPSDETVRGLVEG